MSEQGNKVRSLKGKLKINAVLRLETGLHIGGASDFAPIGAVDSPFIRDPYTKQPIIPGSSLKGKIRTLLARSLSDTPWLNGIEDDKDEVKVLFGTAGDGKNGAVASRLQFTDIRLTEESLDRLRLMDLDTFIGEVKFENKIDRISARATPRQIERVPAGAEFAFSVTYSVEVMNETAEDIRLLADGLKMLQMDYLGGSGSRGYGRVSFRNFAVEVFSLNEASRQALAGMQPELENTLKGCCLI